MAFTNFHTKWAWSTCLRCKHVFPHRRRDVRRWCSRRCAALARKLGQQGTLALQEYHRPRRRDGQSITR